MKKTLLMAAAALAAGVISSQAGVYSQNIVGYVNVPTITPGNSYLLSVPFTIGVSNGANEVFGTTLADFTQVLLWNEVTGTYTTYQTDSGSATGWDDGGFSTIAPPVLPVGKGFFLIPSAAVTNTFAGAIAVSVGSTNKVTLATAGLSYLVGEAVPYGGAATNSSVNLNGLADFTQVLIWNAASGTYTTFQTDSGSSTGWDDGGFSTVAPPSIAPGQAFFLIPSANNAVWSQSL